MCVVTLLIRLVSVPPRASEWLNVAVKFSNTPFERGQEQEARVGRLPGRDIAEVDGQRRRHLLVADLGADDLEGIEQALLVLDDLRLGRGDREIVGRAAADVGHQQSEDGRLARHDDLRRERVVADHVGLQEVIELQLGLRIDGDRGREDRNRDGSAGGVGEADGAADVVLRGTVGRRGIIRNERERDRSGTVVRERGDAIDDAECPAVSSGWRRRTRHWPDSLGRR